MRSYITRALSAAAAAGIAFLTVGFAGAGAPATAAAPSLGPPVYTAQDAGYAAAGRWFRYVQTTVTVPPVTPATSGCNMIMGLHHAARMGERADILVAQGGGAGSVGWGWGGQLTPFTITPKVGDQLQISVYYDRNGHTSFTATDVTQGVTRTVQVNTGAAIYNEVSLAGNASSGPVAPPAADTRLWAVAGTHLTTYTGTRGTLTGPWQASQQIQTSTGTAAGTVMRSPSGLWNGGANFGIWQRALPRALTNQIAGYEVYGNSFRFAATTLTVPTPLPATIAKGGASIEAGIMLNAPAERAQITMTPGGGSGSVTYRAGKSSAGALKLSPAAGDQVALSIYYDRQGHDFFTATDTTQGTTDSVQVTVGNQNYNDVWLVGSANNSALTPPPADTQLWQFTGTHVTTYSGVHGTIQGPWNAAQFIDTLHGAASDPVVMDAPGLSNAGQDFTVWLRHW